MTKIEIILEALTLYGSSSAKQLSGYIKRQYDEEISPASVSGQLRKPVAEGKVSKSNLTGTTVYWIRKERV